MTAETFLAIFGVTLGITGLTLSIRTFRPMFRVQNATDEELEIYAQDTSNGLLYALSLQELEKRGKDLSKHLSQIFGLLLSSKKWDRKRGITLMERYFPKWAKDLDPNWISPSREQLEKTKEIANQALQTTSASARRLS